MLLTGSSETLLLVQVELPVEESEYLHISRKLCTGLHLLHRGFKRQWEKP